MRLWIGCLLFVAAAAACSAAAEVERYSAPPVQTWWDDWYASHYAAPSSHRKLQQNRVGFWSTPSSHNGSTTCNVQLVGTGAQWGVKSAHLSCSTTDEFWLQSSTGTVTIFTGFPIANYFAANPSNLRGVNLFVPQDGSFPSDESILFFTQIGKINFNGSVSNMNVVNWATMHVENATDAVFKHFTWMNNTGQRFPTLAGARSRILVDSCYFVNNTCTNNTRCHTPGIYVSEGERLTVTNTTFKGNRGNLAGALMITAGAVAVVSNNTFIQNSTPNYGQFGGAVFHDTCQDPRTHGLQTQFLHNKFIDNYSNGFGGAIRLGSPPSSGGGCPKAVIRSNLFQNNSATITGGAIMASYCNGIRPVWSHNVFKRNTASQFAGTWGLNAQTLPPAEPASVGPIPAGAGCPRPKIGTNAFAKGDTVYSPPWFFP